MEFETKRLYTKTTNADFSDYIEAQSKDAAPSPDIMELLDKSLAEHSDEVAPEDFPTLMCLCEKWRGNALETLKVIRKDGDEVIGYFQFMDADTPTPYVGLELIYKYRHMGYGTELLLGALDALRHAGGIKLWGMLPLYTIRTASLWLRNAEVFSKSQPSLICISSSKSICCQSQMTNI